ncbi:GEVED domain-containing protein [Puniceibacterium confluentis]|uniref:GEVED domain-containing protein n=1 Tax=Puniceibacterium confluentis TaxID=1958944 RepID=UPI001C979AA8|nr:GEVED domain-containing protein [Puniceibacterium confluentis]
MAVFMLAMSAKGAAALTPGDISFQFTTGNVATGNQKMIVDSNNCDGGDGPRAAYIGGIVTNTSLTTISGLQATVSGLDTLAGFDFTGGQAPVQTIGSLQPGASQAVYWFVTYPCTVDLTDAISFDFNDTAIGTVSSAASLTTLSSIAASAGGLVNITTISAGNVIGNSVFFDVQYQFGNAAPDDEYFLQLAGNTDFDAECFRLKSVEIISSGVDAIPAGTIDQFYFQAPGRQGGSGHLLDVKYELIYMCSGASTTAQPYSAQTSGNNLKYTGNFDSQPPVTFLPGINPLTVEKTSSALILPAEGGATTFTVTFSNSSTTDTLLNRIEDTLPDGMVFATTDLTSEVTESNSSAVPATGATGTVVWESQPDVTWVVPANGTLVLRYNVSLGAGDKVYSNSVVGIIGNETVGPATASVVVGTPVVTQIVAEDDDFAASPLDGVVGGLSGDAFANDTIALVPVDAANVTATVLTVATPNNPGDPVPFLETSGPDEGRVTVPASTPAGIYRITYEVCEDANPGNCDQAQIIVGVLNGIGVDYGDAPISYGAPLHNVPTVPSVYLGAVAPDIEAAPASGAGALGDDSANQDDEDGIVLPVLTQGVSTTLSVDVVGDGFLQAWLDYNGDGAFEDALGERIATDLRDDGTGDDAVAGDGVIQFNVFVPVDATTALTYARFRYSTQSGLLFSDYAADGEVEDYSLVIAAADLVDRGDAPASYGDPRHAVVASIYLGAGLPDSDIITIHSANADGDDLSASDDEDAVAAFPPFTAGSTSSLTVTTHETLSDTNALLAPALRQPGITNLQVWIDFDGDGVFSTEEHVAINYRDGGTGDTDGVFNDSITLDIPVPASAINGDTFARLRWSTSSALASDPFDGFNADGEVEDYKVTIVNPDAPVADLSITKAVRSAATGLPITTAQPGDAIDFVISVSNAGPASPTGVKVSELIPDGYEFVSDDAAANGDTYDAGTGLWDLGQVLAGETETLIIRVTMGDTGNTTNIAEIIASSLPDPDSDPDVGPLTDDLSDGIADDDEASVAVTRDTSATITLQGQVINDNGAGGGTAHDGLYNGTEQRLGGRTVELRAADTTLIATASTLSDGSYSFTVDNSHAGTALTLSLAEIAPTERHISSNPGPFTDADRQDGSLTFTPAVNTSYAELNFGVVDDPTLTSDRQVVVQSGGRIDIGHRFIATSDISTDFAVANIAESTPGITSISLWRDFGCDFGISPGDTAIDAPISSLADDEVCIVASVQTSNASPAGTAVSFDLTANATFTGTTESVVISNTDLVTINGANAVELEKQVCNASQGACDLTTGTGFSTRNSGEAGDVLIYRISFLNSGNAPISAISIGDTTPAYTSLTANAPDVVDTPANFLCNLTTTPTSSGYQGSLQWQCSGSLLPQENGTVYFEVTIQS